jgi:hypothetical protein
MHPVYALESLPDPLKASLFLAGPTPRDLKTPSWRPEALRMLGELGYRGTVIVPEPRSGEWRHSYVDQTSWEAEMRARADLIAFWVPRELTHMPAFTTNIEFGEDYDSCRCLYGRPAEAPKTRYLDVRWLDVSGCGPYARLRDLLTECVSLLGDGVLRTGAERDVPLGVWRSPAFAAWYKSMRASGRALRSFQLRYAVPQGKRHPASPITAFLAEAVIAPGAADAAPKRQLFLAKSDGVTVLNPAPLGEEARPRAEVDC